MNHRRTRVKIEPQAKNTEPELEPLLFARRPTDDRDAPDCQRPRLKTENGRKIGHIQQEIARR